MVQVSDQQRVAEAIQQVEKTKAIRPTGNSNEDLPIRGKLTINLQDSLNFLEHTLKL
jgi:hypothetical protein